MCIRDSLLKLSRAFDRVKWVTIVTVIALATVCVATAMMSFK